MPEHCWRMIRLSDGQGVSVQDGLDKGGGIIDVLDDAEYSGSLN